MTKFGTRECKICDKKIKISFCRNAARDLGLQSEEGVFFNFGDSITGVWFCNRCWYKILEKKS